MTNYPFNYHVLADLNQEFREKQDLSPDDVKWLLESLNKMCNAYDEVVDIDPLTAADFHTAAEGVGVDTEEENHGIKEDALYEFFDESTFDNYPSMDGISLTYGIVIGVQAMRNKLNQGD